jgi:ATP-dependent protease ClpP protease subunit
MPTAPMIAERALERDLFMTPEQAKEFRLVDHIKESRKEVEEEEEAAVDKANV